MIYYLPCLGPFLNTVNVTINFFLLGIYGKLIKVRMDLTVHALNCIHTTVLTIPSLPQHIFFYVSVQDLMLLCTLNNLLCVF